jgi:hypothetical protein
MLLLVVLLLPLRLPLGLGGVAWVDRLVGMGWVE